MKQLIDEILNNDEVIKAIDQKDWKGLRNLIYSIYSDSQAYATIVGLCWNNDIKCLPIDDHDIMYYNTVPENFFLNNNDLKMVKLPEGIFKLRSFSFCNSFIQHVEFPKSLDEIGGDCFNNSAIEEAILPDELRIIKENAFNNCSKLKKVTLPNNGQFNIIPANCFRDCESLKEITIPMSVKEIRSMAFAGIPNLKIKYEGRMRDFKQITMWRNSFKRGQIVSCWDGTLQMKD